MKNIEKIEKKSKKIQKIGDVNFNFKKSLGQNFIFDTNLLKAIVSDGEVGKNDLVIEIGAGAGSLTRQLARVSKKVISFEIDKMLIPTLNNLAEEYKNIEFHFYDFMDCDIENLFEGRAKVVANIPYYITTPIVFKLVDHIEKFDSILLLVQKEVAIRFASECGGKDYGITSVILQSIFDVSIPRIVKKECFTPSPKVDSALCKLVPHKKYNIENFDDFKRFVHLAFSMRRKTLINNLKSEYSKESVSSILKKLGYIEMIRPEQICVENFIKIFEFLNKTYKNA